MAVVAFVAVFLGILGGPWSAGQSAVTLAYVLAVMVPAPASQVGGRELGWALGVGGAGLDAVLRWPVRARMRARRASATAAAAIAELTQAVVLGSPPADQARARRAVDQALAELRRRAVDVVYRPAGTARRDRELSALVVSLLRCARFALAMDPAFTYGPGSHVLARAVVDVLENAARMLNGDADTAVDLKRLANARRDQEALLERHTAEQLARGEDARALVAHLHGTFDLRGLAVGAAIVGANTVLLMGDASASDVA